MSYARKNKTGVWSIGFGVLCLMAFSGWQFYEFVTFKTKEGLFDTQGGHWHLWIAILSLVFACVGGFFVLSAFVQHDRDDDLHITSNV